MDTGSKDLDSLLDGGAGRRLAYVEVPREGSAQALRIPLGVVAGSHPGRTVWINACLHGDEYLGPAAMLRLLERLRPQALRGRLVLTPTLNPGALRAMQRTDPAGSADLNRVWAVEAREGRPDVSIGWAETVLLPRSDAVIDLHSGGNHFLQAPFSVYPVVGGAAERESSALAKACGLPWIWAHRGSILEGALITAAARKGKAAVLLEMEGEGKAEPAWVDRMVGALEGALAHLGLIEGTPRFRASYRVFEGFTIVRNREEGLWSRAVDPGAEVRAGGPLGTVRDLLGAERERVSAPVDAVVVGICTYGFVPADDYVAELAHGFRAERAPA